MLAIYIGGQTWRNLINIHEIAYFITRDTGYVRGKLYGISHLPPKPVNIYIYYVFGLVICIALYNDTVVAYFIQILEL